MWRLASLLRSRYNEDTRGLDLSGNDPYKIESSLFVNGKTDDLTAKEDLLKKEEWLDGK